MPDSTLVDDLLAAVRAVKETAIDAEDFARGAELRGLEARLLAIRAHADRNTRPGAPDYLQPDEVTAFWLAYGNGHVVVLGDSDGPAGAAVRGMGAMRAAVAANVAAPLLGQIGWLESERDDHHAADRGRPARSADEILQRINSDHRAVSRSGTPPCCSPTGPSSNNGSATLRTASVKR